MIQTEYIELYFPTEKVNTDSLPLPTDVQGVFEKIRKVNGIPSATVTSQSGENHVQVD